MQANTQFQGACWTQIAQFGNDLNMTYNEFFQMYLPMNWFNFADRLRINLVDFASLQQQCQVFNILGSFKVLFTLDGFFGLFARLIPQAFILKTQFETI